jgi:hypothetical protein
VVDLGLCGSEGFGDVVEKKGLPLFGYLSLLNTYQILLVISGVVRLALIKTSRILV